MGLGTQPKCGRPEKSGGYFGDLMIESLKIEGGWGSQGLNDSASGFAR